MVSPVIRTFYWDVARRSRRPWRRRSPVRWRYGNAGDTFNRDLLQVLYPGCRHRIVEDGPRVLMVGSVAHRVTTGDVVVGIGIKDKPVPAATRAQARVLAVRGPLTYEAFAAAGHDVTDVRFQFDPGLLISRLLSPDDLSTTPVVGRQLFIPHFRDPADVKSGLPAVRTVSIDSDAVPLAKEILAAEIVFSSSLHGIIFAHALGRPCVPIRPASAEPLVKYSDYFASVNLPCRLRDSLTDALRDVKPDSPVDQPWLGLERAFPTIDDLVSWGVAG
jgi:pyruvyltransferase